ncbi:MAG TPA: hypothetical protein VGR73_18235 [Bryobacteraceae bacterium]|nr:hypothetical protein [Bryobacteraceae bacterium]
MIRKLALILCLAAVSVTAQWPNRPTPGLPRTPDGKVNLSTPAPRTADGKPDLSGVWLIKNPNGLFYTTGDSRPENMLPWAAALYKQRADNYRRDTDGIRCLPPGPKIGFATGPYPVKLIQTPELIVALYEYQTLFRQFFMDGRALPEDPNPAWMGYSIAHWEGDTLVVASAGYNDRTSLDLAGHPHTEALRVTERYHRRDVGHLDLQVTFDDPKAYAKPWTLPVELNLVPDGQMLEYVCENEKDKVHLVGQSGEEVSVAREVLAQYTGTYDSSELFGGVPEVISLEGNRLMIDPGAGKVPLFAHGENDFTMEGTGVKFVKDANGAVTGMIQSWTEGDRYFARRK